jgi:hypothetical protein
MTGWRADELIAIGVAETVQIAPTRKTVIAAARRSRAVPRPVGTGARLTAGAEPSGQHPGAKGEARRSRSRGAAGDRRPGDSRP